MAAELQPDPETIAPILAPWAVVLAASAGGISALQTLLSGVDRDFAGAILIVQHRSPRFASVLDKILERVSPLPVKTAVASEPILGGSVYVARPDLHLVVGPDRTFAYHDGTRVRGVRSSANPLLESLASVFGPRCIAVVLTGYGRDATDGVQAVKAAGGIVIAQDPMSAHQGSMPLAAIATGAVDQVLPLEAIAPALDRIVGGKFRRARQS